MKRIFNVTFSDFKQITLRLLPKFWKRFPKRCFSCPEVCFDKNCVFLTKTVIPLLFSLRGKNYRSFGKNFHHDCLKCNKPVHSKSWGKMALVKMFVIYWNFSDFWAKKIGFLAGNYQQVYHNWILRFQKINFLCKSGFFCIKYRLFSVLDLSRKSFSTLGDIFWPNSQNRILRIEKKILRKMMCFEVFVHSKIFPDIGQKLSGL